MHQTTNCKGHPQNVLALTMANEEVKSVQNHLIQLEGISHQWDYDQFLDCIYQRIGTNIEAKEAIHMFEIIKKEDVNGKTLLFTLLIVFIGSNFTWILDLGSDIALLLQSRNDVITCSNDTINGTYDICNYQSNISGDQQFWYTLVPVVLPFIFFFFNSMDYIVESKKKEDEIHWIHNTAFGFFGMLIWPLILLAKITILRYQLKITTNDAEQTKEKIDKFEKLYNDAKNSEVFTEACLQPLLQFHILILASLEIGAWRGIDPLITWKQVKMLEFRIYIQN